MARMDDAAQPYSASPYVQSGFKVQVLPCFCYMFSPGEVFVEVEA
jgi:hypothetical protein